MTTRQQFSIFTCTLLALLLIGCAPKSPHYSGWLGTDYSKLHESPDIKGGMVWSENRDVLQKYNKFIIEDIKTYFPGQASEETREIDPELLNSLIVHFKKALIREMSKSYEVVDTPGEGVARVSIALTGVRLDDKDLAFYQYVPVALALTAATEVTGLRANMAVLTLEGKMVDSLTGQPLIVTVQQRARETRSQKLQSLTNKDVYPILDRWAVVVKQRVDQRLGK